MAFPCLIIFFILSEINKNSGKAKKKRPQNDAFIGHRGPTSGDFLHRGVKVGFPRKPLPQ